MALELRIDADNNLPVIPFISLLGVYSRGGIDSDGVKSNIEAALEDTLTADEITDVNMILSTIDGFTTDAEKSDYIFKVFHIFNLAEYDVMPAFNDRATVKAALDFV